MLDASRKSSKFIVPDLASSPVAATDVTTVEKRIASGADDVEQRSIDGNMLLTSTDLDLVVDGISSQTLGLRFTALDIPAGAVITAAYVQFQADERGSSATSLLIRGLDSDDLSPFTNAYFNLSSRATTTASAIWQPLAWTIVDQAGIDQRTPDLSALVQQIVSRPGWQAGNDLGFVISGSGTRTADSYEGGALKAPLLHIEYRLPTTSNAVPAIDLDASAAGQGYATLFGANGAAVAIADSDALITDSDDTNMERLTVVISNPKAGDQLFVSGTLPAGIGIGANSTSTSLILTGSASAASYEQALEQVRFDNEGGTVDPADRQVQVTVNDGQATSGPAVATVAIEAGTSTRTIDKRIASGADDVEQRSAGGNMLLTSPDLDLVVDGSASQTVGLRFTALDIPAGAVITAAYVQFQADEKQSGATSLLIRGLDSDDSSPFTNAAFNLSSRETTSASASWQPLAWTALNQVGAAQRTPDLSALVQEIVSRPGWQAGNDLGFVISGSGTRTADSYEGGALKAPLLHIEYRLPTTSNAVPAIDLDASAAGQGYATLFSANGAAVAIADSDVLISDSDDTNMEWLSVSLTNPKAGDQLFVGGTLPAGISVAPGSTSSSILLTGTASLTSYQTAVRQVLFENRNASPDTTARQVQVTVNDGTASSSPAVASISIVPGTAAGDIVLDANSNFRENVAGATVGTLSVANAEQGQSYDFSVADARFEIVGTELKLRDGIRLDFERVSLISLDITATPASGPSFVDGVTAPVIDVPETRFAAFGDYGNNAGAAPVAQLVNSLNVDFIITTGDNTYGSTPIDDQIGNKYSSYIGNYQGAYGSGSATNRFWPSIGNHEYAGEGGGVSAYRNYFTLPGNELYYDFVIGPVHFFAIDSNSQQPDGRSGTSIQAQWLQGELAASTSPYNIVFFHHPPFSSGANHGSSTTMRWPFEQWGATAVLSGHEHIYERVHRDDNLDGTILPYFITGLGGAGRYALATPVEGSQLRFADNWGTMLIQASAESITFEFIAITGGGQGTLIDSYTIDLPVQAAIAAVDSEAKLFGADERTMFTADFDPDFGTPPRLIGAEPASTFDYLV